MKEYCDVAILMSTYNGEEYILDQLDSLSLQTYRDFTLYVRDDGSTDNTVELIKSYNGLKIVFIDGMTGNHRPAKSFLYMLSVVESDLYFFCDQDDYWLPDKLSNAICLLEKYASASSKPALFHTELTLVDEMLNKLGANFHQADGVDPELFIKTDKMYVENCVVGCTVGINRLARDFCISNTDLELDIISMHDWWLALCVRKIGVVLYDVNPSILYRQHGRNVSGSSFKREFILSKINISGFKKIGKMKADVSNQLISYKRKFSHVLTKHEAKRLNKITKYILDDTVLSWVLLFCIGVKFTKLRLNIAAIIHSLFLRSER